MSCSSGILTPCYIPTYPDLSRDLIRQRTGLPGLAPAATCALAGRRRWRWRCLRGSSCTAVQAVEALLHLLEALG